MKKFMGIIALSTLAACGYSEDSFSDDLASAYCAWAVECYSTELNYADEAACLAAYSGVDAEGDYDASQAKTCVSDVEALTCSDAMTDFPASCATVYSGSGSTETGDSGM